MLLLIAGSLLLAGLLALLLRAQSKRSKSGKDEARPKAVAVPKAGNPTGKWLICGGHGPEDITLEDGTVVTAFDNSQPVAKLLAYLHLIGWREGKDFFFVPYNTHMMARSPLQKIPYAIRPDGTVATDSSLIIEGLEKTRQKAKCLDAWLGKREVALATAVDSLINGDLYWAMVHHRFCTASCEKVTPGWILEGSGMPPFVAYIVFKLVIQRPTRVAMRSAMGGAGRGGHEMVDEHGVKHLEALATLVSGPSRFLFGDKLCSADLNLFAHLVNLALDLSRYPEAAIVRFYKESKALRDYTKRVQEALVKG